MHFSTTPLGQSRYWTHSSYTQDPGPTHFNAASTGNTYVYGSNLSSSPLNADEVTLDDEQMSADDLTESRRPTVTQELIRQQMQAMRNAMPAPSYEATNNSTYYRTGEPSPPAIQGHYRHSRRNEDLRLSDVRNIRHTQGPYSRNSGREFHRTTSLERSADPLQHGHSYSSQGSGHLFSSEVGGGIAIPQALPMDFTRQAGVQGGTFFPSRGEIARSRSQAARSPPHDWSSERSGSSAATPAPTEGSADPAQSDQDESDFAAISTSPTTSTSTSSSTASRWARFRVPDDVFSDPYDPVRHELYHQIKREPWFISQDRERPITPGEASRIPGSIPGESVLLAFYDRVSDAQGKTVLRCTICMQTNPQTQLYPRPDRAKVHMRHHFELRPIPCNGKCDVPHCMQRFFTMGDLTAHVTGKTEPLATCQYCGKTMRAKNLKRHVGNFCHRAPPEDRRNRG